MRLWGQAFKVSSWKRSSGERLRELQNFEAWPEAWPEALAPGQPQDVGHKERILER